MRTRPARITTSLSIAVLALAAAAVAQTESEELARQRFDAGWTSYQRYCQTCHGTWGRGDGVIVQWLKVPPADLSQLSESNGGVFPEERVVRAIDGREAVRLHGRREMPVWGKVLRDPEAPGDPEIAVAERIAEILEVVRALDRGLGPAAAEPPG